MSRVAALAGGRTNAGPPWGLWRTGSLYHACQGPARLFRFVASLCREQMFAVICCSHKMKTPTVSRSALSHQGHYCSRRGHVSSWQRPTPRTPPSSQGSGENPGN